MKIEEIINRNCLTNVSPPKNLDMNISNSSIKQQRAKAIESNYRLLIQVIHSEASNNNNVFTFADYLTVLKKMNFVSEKYLTQKEEELVTKSWHQISFFYKGNIVTNSDNIGTFLSGVIGL